MIDSNLSPVAQEYVVVELFFTVIWFRIAYHCGFIPLFIFCGYLYQFHVKKSIAYSNPTFNLILFACYEYKTATVLNCVIVVQKTIDIYRN